MKETPCEPPLARAQHAIHCWSSMGHVESWGPGGNYTYSHGSRAICTSGRECLITPTSWVKILPVVSAPRSMRSIGLELGEEWCHPRWPPLYQVDGHLPDTREIPANIIPNTWHILIIILIQRVYYSILFCTGYPYFNDKAVKDRWCMLLGRGALPYPGWSWTTGLSCSRRTLHLCFDKY